MNNKLIIVLLTISIVANLVIGATWFYADQQGALNDCMDQNRQLESKLVAFKTDLNKSREEEKYLLEIMLKSGADFQKYMPEYADISKEQFVEKIRQKVVELKVKLQ